MAGKPETYDVLILDAANKQSLAAARSLGRAGLRAALGESAGQYRPHLPPAFRSRYCARSVTLPNYLGDRAAYVESVVDFSRAHRVRVVLPTGTLENAIRSGVDFPLMTWQWAAGQRVQPVHFYRTGVRTRWLHGDLRWLRENRERLGRPDSVCGARAAWAFTSEFARTRNYDYFDRRDLGPALAELRNTVRVLGKTWR